MMPLMYDAIIVGAGPAGGTAACFLGEAGLRVLVLEKEALPRYKTCGGALSATLLTSIFSFSFQDVFEARPQAMAYALGDRLITIRDPQRRLCTVMRSRFDEKILAHARAEVITGATVRSVHEDTEGVHVECADGRVFRSRFLIGADGANSVVAHSLGLRPQRTLVAAIEAEAPAAPELLRRYGDALLFIFGELRNGYLWIFPKGDHLSVGAAALRPQPGELQATLQRVMARYGLDLGGVPIHGHPIPITVRREVLHTRRCLLVGDAAGLADPISGEGIRLAIQSGKLAAESILAGRVDDYSRQVWRQIGRNHALSLRLAWFFYRFLPLCYALGVPNPSSTYAFLDLLSGQAGYPAVIFRLVASLPRYWAARAFSSFTGVFAGQEKRQRLRQRFPE